MATSPGPAHASWTSQPILPRYHWQEAQEIFEYSGSQAAHISLVRRRIRETDSKVEPELYVCKWYKTGGVKLDSIGGPKYIQREYETLSSLRHGNIVRYVDFGYDPRGAKLARLYLEYCSGGDLRQYETAGDKNLSTRQSAQVLHQVAQALLYLHHGIDKHDGKVRLARTTAGNVAEWQPILHRDIKPANSGVPCLLAIETPTDSHQSLRVSTSA